ncbi:copper amine oxidase domain protein [Bacillus sp. OxB-1]|uniref:DUF6612 family protein n=1 Tax=Bacillus sp. (strain OxB-1) TaxID=98228 RepID=UPI000581BED5|nr:DUF6612 family protein [Bacillus sp. OxB-1]BAQ10081.1 copper amine oxidase domain protein [Bacillus sp. OxB-1]
MKKLASWLFAFALLFSLALPTATHANTDAMKFIIDGVEVDGYEQPFMSHGDVLIPIENLFDEAGFQVTKGKNGQVSVTNSYLTVDFNAAAKNIQINGEKANAEFPLTLKNAGNYISGEFLSSLEGFDVEVSEDEKTVNVTTNRVKDVEAFLKKSMEAELNSFSADMVMDMNLETSTEELGSMDMTMDMKMDFIEKPMAMYMAMNMLMQADGEKEDMDMEMYFTEDAVYQQMDGVWVKDEMSKELLEAQLDSANMLEQFELLKTFMKGIHVFEYEDSYVVVQNITTEDFKEMMSEAMELLPALLPDMLGTAGSEVMVEGAEVTEEATNEEVTTEETSVEATEEAAAEDVEEVVIEEELPFEDLEGLLEMLNLDIKEFYTVSTYDKATLFPLDMSGAIHITMNVDDVDVSLKMDLSGNYTNHNNVKEIKVPAEVIKNAITMEQWFEELEKQWAAEEVPAE